MNEKAKQSLLATKDFSTGDVMFWLLDAKAKGADTAKAEKALFAFIYELNNLIHNNAQSVKKSGGNGTEIGK